MDERTFVLTKDELKAIALISFVYGIKSTFSEKDFVNLDESDLEIISFEQKIEKKILIKALKILSNIDFLIIRKSKDSPTYYL